MSPKILVACEFSGRVRDAFIKLGYDAISCDLLDTESPGPHIKGDVVPVLREPWDLVIAHPPCTYLCNSGVCHMYNGGKKKNGRNMERWVRMREGIEFFAQCLEANSLRVAVENPIMHGHARRYLPGDGKPSFIVQPWNFGDPFMKTTCFWTKGLPPLKKWIKDKPAGAINELHRLGPSDDRGKKRSVTYPGLARAIAHQWGPLLEEK